MEFRKRLQTFITKDFFDCGLFSERAYPLGFASLTTHAKTRAARRSVTLFTCSAVLFGCSKTHSVVHAINH